MQQKNETVQPFFAQLLEAKSVAANEAVANTITWPWIDNPIVS